MDLLQPCCMNAPALPAGFASQHLCRFRQCLQLFQLHQMPCAVEQVMLNTRLSLVMIQIGEWLRSNVIAKVDGYPCVVAATSVCSCCVALNPSAGCTCVGSVEYGSTLHSQQYL
jgi:hypothetical protein